MIMLTVLSLWFLPMRYFRTKSVSLYYAQLNSSKLSHGNRFSVAQINSSELSHGNRFSVSIVSTHKPLGNQLQHHPSEENRLPPVASQVSNNYAF